MSKVISIRLKDDQVERLGRAARQLGRTPSETAALLLEEALRQRDTAFVDFRDSPVGRQAYLKGTRIAVWQAVSLARSLDGDATHLAAHLDIPAVAAAAALVYAQTYPEEIEAAIDDNAHAAANLGRMLPNFESVTLDAAAP